MEVLLQTCDEVRAGEVLLNGFRNLRSASQRSDRAGGDLLSGGSRRRRPEERSGDTEELGAVPSQLENHVFRLGPLAIRRRRAPALAPDSSRPPGGSLAAEADDAGWCGREAEDRSHGFPLRRRATRRKWYTCRRGESRVAVTEVFFSTGSLSGVQKSNMFNIFYPIIYMPLMNFIYFLFFIILSNKYILIFNMFKLEFE